MPRCSSPPVRNWVHRTGASAHIDRSSRRMRQPSHPARYPAALPMRVALRAVPSPVKYSARCGLVCPRGSGASGTAKRSTSETSCHDALHRGRSPLAPPTRMSTSQRALQWVRKMYPAATEHLGSLRSQRALRLHGHTALTLALPARQEPADGKRHPHSRPERRGRPAQARIVARQSPVVLLQANLHRVQESDLHRSPPVRH